MTYFNLNVRLVLLFVIYHSNFMENSQNFHAPEQNSYGSVNTSFDKLYSFIMDSETDSIKTLL